MISATGLMPVIAAPTATPMMADSEMGVSRTLSSPNSSARPFVTLKAPFQYRPTSSPIRNMLLSLAISSRKASRRASRYDIVLMCAQLLGIQVLQSLLRLGIGAFRCKFDCFLHISYDGLFNFLCPLLR